MKYCCVVLGGYVNGYGIISELYSKIDDDIILFDSHKLLASKSNKIKDFKFINDDANALKEALKDLKKEYDKLIIFPTSDNDLENLYTIYDEIKEFSFIPLNKETYKNSIKKDFQYKVCKNLSLPIPNSVILKKGDDIKNRVESLLYPIIIKPTIREDHQKDVFRNIILNSTKELNRNIDRLNYFLNQNIEFLVSEFIPGDDATLYSHVGYRTKSGKIVEDWIGHKLSQYPKSFGVVSVGINEAPEIVREQSKMILSKLNIHGLFQTEFKYDHRDKKYKLMEVNLRSMMWNKIGYTSGVYTNYALYLDALSKPFKREKKEQKKRCFIYMKHEILNLLQTKKYFKKFLSHILCKRKTFAIFDSKDIKPFLFDSFLTMKAVIYTIGKKILKNG